MPLRLLPRALTTLSWRRGLRGCRSGIGTLSSPERYLPVHELRRGDQVVDRAFGDDVAAVDAGAGADVEHVIGGADGVLVVLDHDDGVAEVAQAFQGFQRRALSRWCRPIEGSSST